MNAHADGKAGRAALVVCLALTAACARNPRVQIAPAAPQTWGVAGQSNAAALLPFLEPYATTIGYAVSSVSIDCYAVGAPCWLRLEPTLHQRMDAFIWWQGEAEIGGPLGGWGHAEIWLPYKGQYQAKLADVARRVRQAAGNPALLFIVLRVSDQRIDGEQDAFIRADRHAIAIQTRDIGFGAPDRAHMLPEQYAEVARRIATRLGAAGDSRQVKAAGERPPPAPRAPSRRRSARCPRRSGASRPSTSTGRMC